MRGVGQRTKYALPAEWLKVTKKWAEALGKRRFALRQLAKEFENRPAVRQVLEE